jgi:hypothetical protein
MRKRHTKALAQAVAVEGAGVAVGPPVTPPTAPKGAGYGVMEDSASDRGSECSEDDDEAVGAASEEDDDDGPRRQGDFSKSRRLRAIVSIWKRKTVRNQYNIVTFLKEANCGMFDTVHCYDTALVVWSKLPNLLAIASLSDLAIGSRPLITPLSPCHLKQRRYKHALYTLLCFLHKHKYDFSF